MAKVFLTNINLKGNQLLNAVIHASGSAPALITPVQGQIYFNTGNNLLYTYTGSTWNPVNGGIIVGASTFYGVTTFAGTANQITVTASGSTPTGTVTLSLPSALTFPGTITVQSGNATTLGGTLSVGSTTTLAASTTSSASLNIPTGTAPTSPNVGDIWLVQANGVLARYGSTPATHTLADLDSVQTLTSKTLTSPTLNSPTMSTPTLGVATATSINGLTVSTTTGTLTLANGSTLATSGANSITLTSTGATTVTLPTSGTLVNTAVTTLSSLVSVGTITTGTWNGSIIDLAHGGTNSNLTAAAGGIVYSTSSGLAIGSVGTTGYVLTSAGTSAPTWTQSTATNVNNAIVQRDGSGNIAVSQVTVSTDPSSALQVATKQYVDNIASGVNAHDSAVTATVSALTATYSNGTAGVGATLTNSGTQAQLVIDGVTPIVGDRILIKNQTTTFQNGIYVVTNVGSGSTNWILTRASDYDQSVAGEVAAGDMLYIVAPAAEITGTPTTQNTSWIMNQPGTIVIGTTPITFSQSSGSGSVTAGTGISVTGNQVSIALGSAFDSTTGTGTSGLSLSGNTLQLRLNPAGAVTSTTAGLAVVTGTGLTISGNAITFASGYGVRKYTGTITGTSTDGGVTGTTTFPITHSLGINDVTVSVYQTSSTPDTQFADVEVDITRNTTNQVTIGFAVAPVTTTTYNVVIVG
jgi:hypothetical protein